MATIVLFKLRFSVFIITLISATAFGQDVSLYQQFNGKFDFTFIGNTLNPEEDSYMTIPVINTSSSATLNLGPNDIVEKAYLYWAGCGPGDYEVKLNTTTITPERIFNHHRTIGNFEMDFFSSFTDITTQIQTTGNGLYTLSELDLNEWIDYYFQTRTNFGGWAIIIIYKNNTLPINQLNLYDGLQAIPDQIDITLNSLNVIDNQNSKIGFLAWEGDENLAVNETLRINGNIIGNPPLNPADNAFNGTNSFTNSDQLHNMDLDVYDLQNNIQVGDTTAQIEMTSGQDFVMINAIVTKLNSQLPDAQIAINDLRVLCNSREVTIDYTVSNFDATAPLQANTPIAIYLNGILIGNTQTLNEIAVDGTENGTITLQIPTATASPFDLKFVVDDDGTGHGIVIEIIEKNNETSQSAALVISQPLIQLNDLISCNEGYGKGIFDFSNYENLIKQNTTDTVTFYPTPEDLQNNTNPILNISNYTAQTTPTSLYVKVDNGNCYNTTSFLLTTKTCPPVVYNFVSANNDTVNSTFHIDGLRGVFLQYKLYVYNRWGKLIWTGNNNTPEWDGYATNGLVLNHSIVPEGTYYYVLELNDKEYLEPLIGYLYLSR